MTEGVLLSAMPLEAIDALTDEPRPQPQPFALMEGINQ